MSSRVSKLEWLPISLLFWQMIWSFLHHPKRSLVGISQLLALFQQVSGLKVNADKSSLYPICMGQEEKGDL